MEEAYKLEGEDELRRTAAQKYIEEYDKTHRGHIMGAVGALLGALAGAIPWAVILANGYISGWLGIFMVVLADRGYDRFKGRIDMMKLYIVVGASLIGILAGEIAGDLITLAADPSLSAVNFVGYYFTHVGEYLADSAANLLIGAVFAAPSAVKTYLGTKKEAENIKKLRLTSQQ